MFVFVVGFLSRGEEEGFQGTASAEEVGIRFLGVFRQVHLSENVDFVGLDHAAHQFSAVLLVECFPEDQLRKGSEELSALFLVNLFYCERTFFLFGVNLFKCRTGSKEMADVTMHHSTYYTVACWCSFDLF